MQIENEELQYFTDHLSKWETAIQRSIQFELLKIDRIVYAHELEYIPFHEEVAPFIEAITLDSGQLPLVLTSFRDSTEKYLSDFISQNEIDHWDLIALLRLLKTVGVSTDKKSKHMHFEMSISKGKDHLFATDSGSITAREKLIKMFHLLDEKFPRSEGYEMIIRFIPSNQVITDRLTFLQALEKDNLESLL